MVQRSKILIVTSQTGGGHISLAEALRDQLMGDYEIEIVDPQPGFIAFHYRLVSRYALWLWGAEFRWMNSPERAWRAHRLFTLWVVRELSALIARSRPALIISTYPFLTSEVTYVLRWLKLSIPFVMLFADPDRVHASWLSERGASATFAPTRETYQQALASGFVAERVHLVGWPVRAQFRQPQRQERATLLTSLGLDAQGFTVFLQGGGEGAAQFTQTVERVLGVGEEIQIILATGTHQRLYRRFRDVPRLYALPFTREIAEYMAAADVIMGKAGPNMLFESVALGKPFIATTYIPGQEEANLEFIRRYGLGWVAQTPKEQHELLTRLMADREEWVNMQRSVEAYWRWNEEENRKMVLVIGGLIEGGE